MPADEVYRRVVVEYGFHYVYVYLSDYNGKVLIDESFRQPYRLERAEASEEAREMFDFVYDMLNEGINFPTAGD